MSELKFNSQLSFLPFSLSLSVRLPLMIEWLIKMVVISYKTNSLGFKDMSDQMRSQPSPYKRTYVSFHFQPTFCQPNKPNITFPQLRITNQSFFCQFDWTSERETKSVELSWEAPLRKSIHSTRICIKNSNRLPLHPFSFEDNFWIWLNNQLSRKPAPHCLWVL